MTGSAANVPPVAPVSAVIKACALDAAYLEATLPHMLRQARYPFAEVVLVVDPRRSFSGKYTRRACDGAAFDGVLGRLLAARVVDRVVPAEARPEAVGQTLSLYLGDGARPEWSHDHTGAPVYSALLGLELARHDLVLLMDADMLFHSSGVSWVAAGVELLQRDPCAWFVMTHAGPPLEEPGRADDLDPINRAYGARWSEDRAAWCFAHVSSRYFLTDRRRLRGRVPALTAPGGLEPLERCFSQALVNAGAYRANLALPGSWDLHAHDHDPPFPAWVHGIIELVERGTVPREQRGAYDLRLRLSAHRVRWRALMQRELPGFDPFAGPR